jgi:hypothetical protein
MITQTFYFSLLFFSLSIIISLISLFPLQFCPPAPSYLSQKQSVIAGVTASVILGHLLAFLSCVIPYEGSSDPAMEAWMPRARSAWRLIAAANAFLSMGVLTGLAAPAIPWIIQPASEYDLYFSGLAAPAIPWIILQPASEYYLYFSWTGILSTVTGECLSPLIIGSLAIYFGLFFCLIAWGLGLCAGARVRGVAVYGRSAREGCCCAPSMPAIQGLLWTGYNFCLGGAVYNYLLTDTVMSLLYALSGVWTTSPGGDLLRFSLVCLFISACMYSVVGCCKLGPLPGVGTSSTNCCCVERNPSQQPTSSCCCGGSRAVAPTTTASVLALNVKTTTASALALNVNKCYRCYVEFSADLILFMLISNYESISLCGDCIATRIVALVPSNVNKESWKVDGNISILSLTEPEFPPSEWPGLTCPRNANGSPNMESMEFKVWAKKNKESAEMCTDTVTQWRKVRDNAWKQQAAGKSTV